MKTLLLIHTDMDGAACEAIARVWIPGVACKRCNYSEIDEAVKAAVAEDWDRIILSDICCSADTLEWLHQRGDLPLQDKPSRVAICDHHANNAWAEYGPDSPTADGFYRAEGCGAEALVWWLTVEQPTKTPEMERACLKLAEVVGVYDTWKIGHPLRPLSEKFNRLFGFMGYRRFVNRCLFRLTLRRAHTLEDGEVRIAEILEDREERYVKQRLAAAQAAKDEKGRPFRWVCANRHTSAVGHALAKHFDYAAIWCPEYGTVQLRSEKGAANVGRIARSRGGGGHDHAAGYPCPGVPWWAAS